MQMSESEICFNFKQAKNQNEQIGILAELNACSVEKILDILQAGGCISDIRAPVGKIKWTPELDKQVIDYSEAGKGPTEIAKLMGLDVEQVRNRKAKLKGKGYIFDTTKTVAEESSKTSEEALFVVDTLQKDEASGAVNCLELLFNSLSSGWKQVGAAVRFVGPDGNVWKMELSRE